MTGPADGFRGFPPSQRAIHARCAHPSGRFVAFPREALAGTLAGRFVEQAARHPERPAIAKALVILERGPGAGGLGRQSGAASGALG